MDSRAFTIHLLRMSDGQPHPSASVPIINGPDCLCEWPFNRTADIKVTSSRLAIVVLMKITRENAGPDTPIGHVFRLFVWDWKTGIKYLVSGFELTDIDMDMTGALL